MAARHWLFAASLPAAPVAGADQTQISSYRAATTEAYGLYVDARPNQSTDIYCGLRFKVDPSKPEKRPTT